MGAYRALGLVEPGFMSGDPPKEDDMTEPRLLPLDPSYVDEVCRVHGMRSMVSASALCLASFLCAAIRLHCFDGGGAPRPRASANEGRGHLQRGGLGRHGESKIRHHKRTCTGKAASMNAGYVTHGGPCMFVICTESNARCRLLRKDGA